MRGATALADRRVVVLPLFAALALAFTSPLWEHPQNLGHGDWLWYHFMWESARKTLVDFHELPLWNPFYCGGNVALANPAGVGLSPLHWPLLALPTAIAMKAHLTLMTFLGLWGAYELARAFFGRGPSAVLGACFFALAGTLGWHMNGQTQMASMELLPWAILFARRASARWPFALAAGAVLATQFLAGAVYPLVITSVAVALDGLGGLASDRAARARSLAGYALAFASAPAYAAIKVLPVVDFLRDHRRPIASDDAIGWRVLVDAFFVRRGTSDQIWSHEGYAYAWWGEYGNYLGVLGVLVALAALALGGRLRREAVLLLVALALVAGDHGAWSPYALLRKLPLVGNLRVPTRYWAVFDLWLACLVARGAWRGARLATLRLPRGVALPSLAFASAVSALAIADLVRTNGRLVFRDAMPTAPAPPDEHRRDFRQVVGAPWRMWMYPPRGEGTLRCFDELTIAISPALRAGLPSEAYLADPTAGSVAITSWAPSTWRLHVTAARDATVVVNQNAYRGWVADGFRVGAREGLVAFDVPAGEREVVLRYVPPGYRAGLAITLGSLAVTAGLLVWRMRRRSEG